MSDGRDLEVAVHSLHTAAGPFARARLDRHAPDAAVELLGALLLRDEPDGTVTVARIVEVEAYREDDPASHSHRGRTARSEPMFWQPGTAYVYRSYGVHWCINVTVEREGVGAAVLLRAAAVVSGLERIRFRRPAAAADAAMLSGPGNLTLGLDLDGPRHNRGDLVDGVAGLRLADDSWRPQSSAVVVGPRVGIRHAPAVPWRFHVAGATAVSAYRRSPRAAPR